MLSFSQRRLHQRRSSRPSSLISSLLFLFIQTSISQKKQVIWQVVNHGHCTFKVKTLKQV